MMAFNEQTENARAHILSIFEKDRRVENEDGEMKKRIDDYQMMIMELWDYLDTLPLSVVENTTVELSGEILGVYDPQIKRAVTNLEQYLAVRIEQGEAEQ